ncbi:MAG: hypothetical protein CMJ85_05105 [Planctomycetes bacterium]|nr:hypothetical protein [Planctomycetota bacterium]
MTEPRNPSHIADALGVLRQRLRRRFMVHGAGSLLAALIGLLIAHYAIDRLLVLPSPIRIIALLGLAVLAVQGLRRRILYPLRRSLSTDDMALLVERNHPRLRQELISAVQLDAGDARGDSTQLIAEVADRAAASLRTVDLRSTLEAKRTVRVWGMAALCTALLAGAAIVGPESFSIWSQRLVGFSPTYPRRTFLTIQIPTDQGSNYHVRKDGDDLRVAMARGTDLPVNVDVEGLVPNMVELVTRVGSSERRIAMARRGKGHHRYVLRRLLHPVDLWAEGGDDPGTSHVVVEVLDPPVATDLAVRIEPPEYTGLPSLDHEGGLVEALPASRITISFRSTEPLASGQLHFQASGLRVPLTIASGGGSDAGPRWKAEFSMPEKADRYRIRLMAKNGLGQPAPGLHSLVPTPDRAPRLRVYMPGPSLQALTPKAAFPLRLLAEDDYGLTSITLRARIGNKDKPTEHSLWKLEPSATGRPPLKHGFLQLFAPKDLIAGTDRPPREGDRLTFDVAASDNCHPDAQQGTPRAFRIDLLAVDELRRRLQARLRGTRRTVERAVKVQEEHEARVDAVIASLDDGDAAPSSNHKHALAAAEAGQQRVRGFLMQIRTDLAAVLDAHLFNGLDPSPALADVVRLYMKHFADHPTEPAGDPAFYLVLDAGRKSGAIGRLDLIGRIADMHMIAHRSLEERLRAALRSLAGASTAYTLSRFRQALVGVQQQQSAVLEDLRELLRLLEDWNDYQDVVRMTRRLLGAERDLLERVRSGNGKEQK